MWQLFDPEHKGYLDKRGFDEMANELGYVLTDKKINAIFEGASKDGGKTIKFSDFAMLMKKEGNY